MHVMCTANVQPCMKTKNTNHNELGNALHSNFVQEMNVIKSIELIIKRNIFTYVFSNCTVICWQPIIFFNLIILFVKINQFVQKYGGGDTVNIY